MNGTIFSSFSCYDLIKKPMCITTDSVVTVTRTTNSDVMCIINTQKPVPTIADLPRHRTLKPIATLPYKVHEKLKLPEGDTDYSALRNVEIKEKKGMELRRERDLFFQKLERERKEKKIMETHCIIKIQAVVRGFLIRPRPISKPKPVDFIPIRYQNSHISPEVQKLQNELCGYAQQLGLKPIPGLSLEARSKHNRRKEKIILAASIRITSFFKLTLYALRAKKSAELAKKNIQEKAANKIQRFFRYVHRETVKRRKQNIKRERAALKIQTRFRIFCDFRRVRERRRIRHRQRQEHDAKIVIYRSILEWRKKKL